MWLVTWSWNFNRCGFNRRGGCSGTSCLGQVVWTEAGLSLFFAWVSYFYFILPTLLAGNCACIVRCTLLCHPQMISFIGDLFCLGRLEDCSLHPLFYSLRACLAATVPFRWATVAAVKMTSPFWNGRKRVIYPPVRPRNRWNMSQLETPRGLFPVKKSYPPNAINLFSIKKR